MQPGTKIADSALRIPCTKDTFLKTWFDLLRPIHRLTPSEIKVAICFVEHWYKLRQTITDDEQLNQILFSPKEKRKVCEEVGLSPAHMRNVIIRLRQRGIIKNGRLYYRYIPIRTEGAPYRLMFIIDDAETTGTNNK